jgi:serine/threonine protein kinase
MSKNIIAGRYVLVNQNAPLIGGTAQVYKAVDVENSATPVAIKIFANVEFDTELIQELFHRETDALKTLKHPHIVEMLDNGYDDVRKIFYVVLEWVDSNLSEYSRNSSLKWDELALNMMLPVLEALALAHTRGIVHRDIKPNNILVTQDGLPKLADFGIAKIVDSLRIGVTVRDFNSGPYSPPERGKKPSHFREDLFSLGVTMISCMNGCNPGVDLEDVQGCIKALSLPLPVADYLNRLTSHEPEARPFNAEIALVELKRLQISRSSNIVSRRRIYLNITRNVSDGLRALFDAATEADLQRHLVKDLSGSTSIRSGNEELAYLQLMGTELSYDAKIDANGGGYLLIQKALPLAPSILERRRESGMPLNAHFTFDRPQSRDAAVQELQQLTEDVALFQSAKDNIRIVNERKGLFKVWNDILQAKVDLERYRQAVIEYVDYRIEGRKVIFTATVEQDENILGQIRRPAGKIPFSGVVDDVKGHEVTIFVNRGDSRQLPKRGSLVIDNAATESAIRRQFQALDEVRLGTGARSDLAELLVDPRIAKEPRNITDIDRIQPNLDQPKFEALCKALGSQDINIVQGPPGTGKTTWIAELVCQYIVQNPGKKVLLTAQTHIAVDNALEKIRNLRPSLVMLRVGAAERISPDVEDLRTEQQMDRWRQEVEQRCQDFLKKWATQHNIVDADSAIMPHLEALSSAEEKESELRASIESLEQRRREHAQTACELQQLAEQVFDLASKVETLPQPLVSDISSLKESTNKYVVLGLTLIDRLNAMTAVQQSPEEIQDEQNETNSLIVDIQAEINQYRFSISLALKDDRLKIASLHDIRLAVEMFMNTAEKQISQFNYLKTTQNDWLRAFGKGPGFEAGLLGRADVVAGTCIGIAAVRRMASLHFDLVIIDEASKATPTEALVAMSIGKQWVLVGDRQQLPPFVEDDLLKKEIEEKYGFKKRDLEETLFDRLSVHLPTACQSVLRQQHRMLPAIGNLVSECFYDGQLVSPRTGGELIVLTKVMERPVMWYSTSNLPRRAETSYGGAGYMNIEEGKRISSWLETLEMRAREFHETVRVGVISGYTAQKNHLYREIMPYDKDRWHVLEIEVNSVDAFQGREEDLLIYSVTRSNEEGKIGFLSSERRLNVALSRGRDGLVIFGDSEHCSRSKSGDNPFLKVLRYIAEHPAHCKQEYLD